MHNVVYIKSVLGSAQSRVQRLTNSIKCRGKRPQTACSSGATHERHKRLSSNVTWLATSYAARCAAAGVQASRARRTCLADRAGRDLPDSTRLQGRRGASGDARRETEWAGSAVEKSSNYDPRGTAAIVKRLLTHRACTGKTGPVQTAEKLSDADQVHLRGRPGRKTNLMAQVRRV